MSTQQIPKSVILGLIASMQVQPMGKVIEATAIYPELGYSPNQRSSKNKKRKKTAVVTAKTSKPKAHKDRNKKGRP